MPRLTYARRIPGRRISRWNALGANASLTLNYMWDRGARFLTVRDLNQPAIPPASATYNVLSGVDGNVIGAYTTPVYLSANRINPRVNHIYYLDNGGNNYYNGLAVQLQRRLAHGIQGSLAYTWPHEIDTNLGGSSNNVYFSGPSSTLYNGNYMGVKGDIQPGSAAKARNQLGPVAHLLA